jgi:hypothetical protein
MLRGKQHREEKTDKAKAEEIDFKKATGASRTDRKSKADQEKSGKVKFEKNASEDRRSKERKTEQGSSVDEDHNSERDHSDGSGRKSRSKSKKKKKDKRKKRHKSSRKSKKDQKMPDKGEKMAEEPVVEADKIQSAAEDGKESDEEVPLVDLVSDDEPAPQGNQVELPDDWDLPEPFDTSDNDVPSSPRTSSPHVKSEQPQEVPPEKTEEKMEHVEVQLPDSETKAVPEASPAEVVLEGSKEEGTGAQTIDEEPLPAPAEEAGGGKGKKRKRPP